MEHINRNCPCCKSQNGKFLYRLSYGNIYKCVDCKTAYTLFNGCDIAKSNEVFEATDFIKTRLYDQYRLRKVARKRLSLLSKFINGGDILEFGSSTGEFLFEAAKKGDKVSSVDLHPIVLNINKRKESKDITHDNMSNNALVGYSVVEEIKILNSNKARIYRLEAGFIKAVSKVLLPICMILDNYYLGCSLQIVARKIISEG